MLNVSKLPCCFSWNTVSMLCMWNYTVPVYQWLWPGLSNIADLCLCFVFRGSYRKKMGSWYDQCSHEQIAFCSYILGQIALYVQKVIVEKIRLHSYTQVLLSGIGSGSSGIFEHKNVQTMLYLFVLNIYLNEREGKFLVTTICPLATKNLYVIDSWHQC